LAVELINIRSDAKSVNPGRIHFRDTGLLSRRAAVSDHLFSGLGVTQSAQGAVWQSHTTLIFCRQRQSRRPVLFPGWGTFGFSGGH
jgi:hypothetical protein